MAAAAIFNHAMTAMQAMKGGPATPAAASTNGTSGAGSSDDASSGSATISANDFLTLLVTEMQNQDPTADTDPNEYINQLVQVNSLEQLIDINQTLTTDLGSTSPSTGSGASPHTVGASPDTPGADAVSHDVLQRFSPSSTGASPLIAAEDRSSTAAAAGQSPGNLSLPLSVPAAHRVAHALDGRVRTQPAANNLLAAH